MSDKKPKNNPKSSKEKTTSKPEDGKKDNKSKETQNKESQKEDSKSKHIGMALLVVLILLLIGYSIYCWQAYVHGWFPFGDFVPNPPVESFCPTCTNPDYVAAQPYPSNLARLTAAGFIENDQDRLEEAQANVGDILSNNCYWWCKGKITDGNSDLVENGNMAKIGTELTDPISNTLLPLSVQEARYPGVKRQSVDKPSTDKSNKYNCDCDSSYFEPIRVVDS